MKRWLHQYRNVGVGSLTDTDWEYFIMWVSCKKVLRKTLSRYIGQAKRLLKFFGFRVTQLKKWEETTRIFGRNLDPKPKREYFALEWRSVQKICEITRQQGDPYIDSVIGRAILTIAYTTGSRVGSLLPSQNKKRAEKHTPITRRNIRKVRNSFHI